MSRLYDWVAEGGVLRFVVVLRGGSNEAVVLLVRRMARKKV